MWTHRCGAEHFNHEPVVTNWTERNFPETLRSISQTCSYFNRVSLTLTLVICASSQNSLNKNATIVRLSVFSRSLLSFSITQWHSHCSSGKLRTCLRYNQKQFRDEHLLVSCNDIFKSHVVEPRIQIHPPFQPNACMWWVMMCIALVYY